ncbi:MAG TPA: PHP domain-containing protein, partial [Candidatus Methylacidiphilales bacterium]
MPYVELHARSAFSFLRGGSLPEHLADAAAKAGLPALALCDRNGLYGAPRLFAERRERGVRPLVGAELAMEDGSVVPVLVASRDGYQNLSRLITRAQLRSPKGESRVRWDEVPEFAAGLIALTGDEVGPVRRALERGASREAEAALGRIVRAFGRGNVCVEVQRHLRRGENEIVRSLRDLAGAHALPLVATNGVLYAAPDYAEVLDV